MTTNQVYIELHNFHAETLYYVLYDVWDYNYDETPLKKYRKYFKSIYDERNN